jgi:hypothetical protein
MFGDRYNPGHPYPFTVNKVAYNPSEDYTYYDVRDEGGVPFRLQCSKDTYLVPRQKILCTVSRPDKNKLFLTLVGSKKRESAVCQSPAAFLQEVGLSPAICRYLLLAFEHEDVFAEAREYNRNGSAEWVIKALFSLDKVENRPHLNLRSKQHLLECYRRICLYVIEDSAYLLQFSEAERESFQGWIAERISQLDTILESYRLVNSKKCDEVVDSILEKIGHSGYIYDSKHKMELLTAIFKLKPELLDNKIDSILDLIGAYAKDWRQASFNHTFAYFLEFYINANREQVYRQAVVEDGKSRILLDRMVRSICYLLLMPDDAGRDRQLYRSMLYHYLSYVRSHNLQEKNLSSQEQVLQKLIEKAFTMLVVPDDETRDFSWSKDFKQIEMLSYQLAETRLAGNTYQTRSFESGNVRFTVSMEGITLSRTLSGNKDRNVLPQGFPGWHNIQIFLDSPAKYSISKNAKLKSWRTFWNNVEKALFEERQLPPIRPHKDYPDVHTETVVRVLARESSERYYCKIEDAAYQGYGWIDTYQKGGAMGLFHYNPEFDIDSFYEDGNPILLRVRVNSFRQEEDRRTFMFDALSFIDQFVKDSVEYDEKSDCRIIFKDEANNMFYGVTSLGYGIFLPAENDEGIVCQVGDVVKVRLTDSSTPSKIQGEVIGYPDDDVNIKEVAEELLHDYKDYCETGVYEETAEELEADAMSVSEDQFEPEYIKEIINIFDHKAVMEKEDIYSYAYLSLAHILSRMIGDTETTNYLAQRQRFVAELNEYANSDIIDKEKLEEMVKPENADIVERFPIIRNRLFQMKMVASLGVQQSNDFLWEVQQKYSDNYLLYKLSKLALSYNMLDGFGMQEQQKLILNKMKGLLNITAELPEIYSFGEEDQLTEFKTSIVYPPNNNMRVDLETQTFNIMKMVCGMANAYGGRIYLGVSDNGIARGLEDDLAYEYFEHNKDKYDRYIRNKIRYTMGDAVNAAIVIEHPEAGKHWIYVIKVAPSKTPVSLEGNYYNRQGSSTYQLEPDLLTQIMNDRDFKQYHVDEPEDIVIDSNAQPPLDDDFLTPTETKEKPTATTLHEEALATSVLRSNVVENWIDGYGIDTHCYLRIKKVGEWYVFDDEDWQDGILTLAIHDDELDGSLIIAYDDGNVNRIPMSQLIDKTRNKVYKMYAGKRPLFVCPARRDAAVLTAYCDDKGHKFARLDDVENLPESRMQDTGSTVTDVSFDKLYACEIINTDLIGELKRMHNQKRTSIGLPMNTKLNKEQTFLAGLGIKI